jgi:hypothetical protein
MGNLCTATCVPGTLWAKSQTPHLAEGAVAGPEGVGAVRGAEVVEDVRHHGVAAHKLHFESKVCNRVFT